MVEPVNLRQFRKRKARDEKKLKADKNRKIHALPTALKKAARAKTDKEITKLDGHKLEPKHE